MSDFTDFLKYMIIGGIEDIKRNLFRPTIWVWIFLISSVILTLNKSPFIYVLICLFLVALCLIWKEFESGFWRHWIREKKGTDWRKAIRKEGEENGNNRS